MREHGINRSMASLLSEREDIGGIGGSVEESPSHVDPYISAVHTDVDRDMSEESLFDEVDQLDVVDQERLIPLLKTAGEVAVDRYGRSARRQMKKHMKMKKTNPNPMSQTVIHAHAHASPKVGQTVLAKTGDLSYYSTSSTVDKSAVRSQGTDKTRSLTFHYTPYAPYTPYTPYTASYDKSG